MTKVQLEYPLTRKLEDEALMDAVARLHGVYGMTSVRLTPSLDRLIVEYDASRLNAHEVEDWMRRFGLPVAAAMPPAA
jgi:hypothetical protein